MKCPKCGLEDNPKDHYSYFTSGFYEGKFVLTCTECDTRHRPSTGEIIK